nr:hypothetical protein Iba_scaffold1634498CG0010 [Ipomoea batatas]GME08420.1 hypothetical protein Iba_scaffold7573CG0010 [Ipomoea batatas]
MLALYCQRPPWLRACRRSSTVDRRRIARGLMHASSFISLDRSLLFIYGFVIDGGGVVGDGAAE